MAEESSLTWRLSLEPSRYAHPPNMILVPRDKKKFKVTVVWKMEAGETRVVGANYQAATRWVVLDAALRPVVNGQDYAAGRKPGKKDMSWSSRTVMGGGAPNPMEVDIELESSKLKNGRDYTLLVDSFGILGTLGFVAVEETDTKAPARKTGKKKARGKKAARKAAPKKAPKKKAAGKRTAKKKPAKRKAAKKKAA